MESRNAAVLQEEWLKEHMRSRFARKLIGVVEKIRKNVLPSDGKDDHQFPQLPGSHLTQVCPMLQPSQVLECLLSRSRMAENQNCGT